MRFARSTRQYPSCPSVTAALEDALASVGVKPRWQYDSIEIDAMREMASRFDVKKELENARSAREAAGLK